MTYMCRRTMTRTKYYTVGPDGTINGGGTENREKADEWLANNDDVVDLIAAESRSEAQRKYID